MEKRLSQYMALAETSSVVAHELCAQLHVMKFCFEELIINEKLDEKHCEFIGQLQSSARSMESLLINYRTLLRMSCDEGETFDLADGLKYAKELLRSHYNSTAKKFAFEGWGENAGDNLECVGELSVCMHIMFAVFSCYVEWEKEHGGVEDFCFIQSLKERDNGSLIFSIKLPYSSFTEQGFKEMIRSRKGLKGRLRQWCGLEYFDELIQKVENFYHFEKTERYVSVSFMLFARRV